MRNEVIGTLFGKKTFAPLTSMTCRAPGISSRSCRRLTNCDTEGNFPPPESVPAAGAARRGELSQILVAIARDPAAWRTSPLTVGYSDPARIPDEVWRAYFTPIGGTIGRAGFRAGARRSRPS